MSAEHFSGEPEHIEKPKAENALRALGGDVLSIVRQADALPVMQNQRAWPQPEEDAPTPGALPPRRRRRQRDEPFTPPGGQ